MYIHVHVHCTIRWSQCCIPVHTYVYTCRYVKASLTGDTLTLKLNLPKKGSLVTLISYFILSRTVMVKVTEKKTKIELKPQLYSPVEDLQLMMCVLNKIEEQQAMDQQYSMFEALFGSEMMIKVHVYTCTCMYHAIFLYIPYSGLFSRDGFFANFEIATICGINFREINWKPHPRT